MSAVDELRDYFTHCFVLIAKSITKLAVVLTSTNDLLIDGFAIIIFFALS